MIDIHSHTTYSDGSFSVIKLLEEAVVEEWVNSYLPSFKTK